MAPGGSPLSGGEADHWGAHRPTRVLEPAASLAADCTAPCHHAIMPCGHYVVVQVRPSVLKAVPQPEDLVVGEDSTFVRR